MNLANISVNKEGEDWTCAVATTYFYNYEDKCEMANCSQVHNTEQNYVVKDCKICKKEYCEWCAEDEFYSDWNHECKICLPQEEEEEVVEEVEEEVIVGEVIMLNLQENIYSLK